MKSQAGNALIDDATTLKGMYDFFWTHAINSDETHAAIDKYCDFVSGNFSNLCVNATMKFYEEKGEIDWYNIYAPLCHDTSLRNGPPGSVSLPAAILFILLPISSHLINVL